MAGGHGFLPLRPGPADVGSSRSKQPSGQVGARYDLQKVLGTGSFSAVCLAHDNLEGDKVALKRVGDVFASLENAKRVLREVCIMRRLEHTNIIRLRDVFLKPSPTGKYVFRGGRLVPTSYDCYMVMEYCDQGDLFNMRGQLPEHEVRSLMWQLLSALRYLHGLNVWHRDIKTGNLLLTLHEGRRLLKVADFGSARSAKDASDAGPAAQLNGRDERAFGAHILGTSSMELPLPLGGFDGMDVENDISSSPLGHIASAPVGRRGGGDSSCDAGGEDERCTSAGGRPPRSTAGAVGCHSTAGGLVAVPAADGGYQPPLTSLVCTPCYRAPEVVMSRGGYSSAIDMWSAGCVFGELLQRAAYLGKASTPHLQVAPVFAITGKPLTPHAGQRYGAAEPGGSASAYAELSALFAVIGSPAWACIEAVPNEAWRRYLYHIPGRAPTLYRRFSQAGEVAVDLLARLLQFDPRRRASAEEAMAHEYFAMLHMEVQLAATGLAPLQMSGLGHVRSQLHRRTASGDGDEAAKAAPASARGTSESLLGSSPLPTWPPRRGPSRRGSGSGGSGPDVGMELEVQNGADSSRSGVVAGRERALGSAIALPTRRTLSARVGVCSSLLTKRKQLEDSREEESSEREDGQQQGWAQQQQAVLADEGGSLTDKSPISFWQIDEPALALAALEAELARLVPPEMPAAAATAGYDSSRAATALQTPEALAFVEDCKERLREMLERECVEHAARAAARRGAEPGLRGPRSSGGGSAAVGSGSGGSVRRNHSDGLLVGQDGQILGGAAGAAALHGHLRPDPGQQLDPSIIGYERIPYHADAAAARLEPEKHLWAGRHGEWTQSSLAEQRREASTGTWGVTLMPPGLDAATPAGKAYIDVMRSQHAR
ncbi:hypothetical protein VOLCADRAFT_88384 [Volvox carteri f. nagariensis]|uniref:Protein kinase domain-containing protein n=1 Tax=Volvox carteri f. nagariensis TaxID=3068 RepID=D8TN79_VOLCA|nr:uncharacterized protein VOLCADRAFT_88384 [Volvox carteri f. nagariensis]EFJ51093.1 hypothetical protein VOLCADRAFT_88384 [Volvox carteri f. nagariensis]|eukprot:XP_002948105.1 hypothetical protein VOLCADRAFT_88384 [Volvox carteri f. nagariensis]